MNQGDRHYRMNYDWVWGPNNRKLAKVATLQLVLSNFDPDQFYPLLSQWLQGLTAAEEPDTYYQGGFSVVVAQSHSQLCVVNISSGGQDVSDSLGYGAESIHDSVLSKLDEVHVEWNELPLQRPHLNT